MAIVAELRDRDVPIRDIAVVARDLDSYEQSLFRAAIQYGIAPVFWRQLYVTRTRPYALVESVCEALDADELDRRTLLRPLEHRWAPSNAPSDDWPVDPATLYRVKHALPQGARPTEEWIEVLETIDDADARFTTFVEWLADVPEPNPETVTSVLGDVVEAYADHGLAVTRESDSPALLDTETDARAVVRGRTLVQQLRHKFADRLQEETLERSWGDVADLANVIATQRPGRREHSNARALDILEANDVWMLDVQYVIAVGMTADEWPRATESVVPPEFQEVVLRGDDDTSKLAPRTAWTDGRDRDQFLDVFRAAGTGVILTRHTQTVDGDDVHSSPFLDHLDLQTVAESHRQQLLSTNRELPPEIQDFLEERAEATANE
ncbi:ATP-dependent helicase/nuclease subunit B [Halobiforma haloterrestris]|uniref:ATP-dependent helicase/nuclease subunit B n=1 Tax=Natronobacterium haloterrestre TaxID=148448 RepID=A0A1I1KJ69_NATHA|nr:ATP-dependent helicase/nuclease subunit B [Halobiforma haloterrestris]